MAQEGLNYVNNTLLDMENKNKYLYNGKEQDGQTRFHEYGFRDYDSQLARWHCPDALSEWNMSVSPYAYVSNKPVNRVDLWGLVDAPYTGTGRTDMERYAYDDGGAGFFYSCMMSMMNNVPGASESGTFLSSISGSGGSGGGRSRGTGNGRKTPGNVIITEDKNYKERADRYTDNKNWDVIYVSDIGSEGYYQLNGYEKNKEISYLVIDTHGDRGRLSIGGIFIDAEDVQKSRDGGTSGDPYVDAQIMVLTDLGGHATKGVIFTGCSSTADDINVIRELSSLNEFHGKYVFGSSVTTMTINDPGDKMGPLNISLIHNRDWIEKKGTFKAYVNGMQLAKGTRFSLLLATTGAAIRILTKASEIRASAPYSIPYSKPYILD